MFLKLFKLHSPVAHAILNTFKTSLMPINHEMHSHSCDFLYLTNNINATNKSNLTENVKPTTAKLTLDKIRAYLLFFLRIQWRSIVKNQSTENRKMKQRLMIARQNIVQYGNTD